MLVFYIVNWLDYSEDRLFGMGRKSLTRSGSEDQN